MKGYIEEGGWVSCTMDSFGTPRQLVARRDAQVKRHNGKILLTKIDTAIDKQFVCNSPVKFWTGLAALAVGIAIVLSGPVGWIALGACAVAAVAITFQSVTSHACNGCLEGIEWNPSHETVKIGGQDVILYNYSQLQCSNGGVLIASETFDEANSISNQMALNNWQANAINIEQHLVNGIIDGLMGFSFTAVDVAFELAGEYLGENNIVSGETWLGVGLGKDATTTILKATPAERALSKEIASSIFTAEFWTVFRKSPRLPLQLISPTSLIKDVGKGLIKGSAVGIPQLILNNMIDAEEEKLRIIDGRDRVQIYLDDQHVATQYQTEIGEDLFIKGKKKAVTNLKILLENMGRVNYGHKLLADSQHKGIRTGVCVDLHFHLHWKQYPLDLQDLSQLDFSKEWQAGAPAFYRYDFQLDHTLDTYLDMTGFGKGVVFVNGHNLGRFWEVGPTTSLYVPHGFLKEGANSLIVFETEGRYQETLQLVQQPTFKEVKGENL